MPSLPTLTKNALLKILAGEEVALPILQILSVQLVNDFGRQYCTLQLSDGEFYHSCHMNITEENEIMKTFDVVQVDQYGIWLKENKTFGIHLERFRVIKTAREMSNVVLGRPGNIERGLIAAIVEHYQQRNPIQMRIQPKKATLTPKGLLRICAGQYIDKPIFQILSARCVNDESINNSKYIVLKVTDGTHVSEDIWLDGTFVERLPELKKRTVFQIDHYVLHYECFQYICIVSYITILNRPLDICLKTELLERRAKLTYGSVLQLFGENRLMQPIVKIIANKNCKTKTYMDGTRARTRLLINDGLHSCSAYIGPDLMKRLKETTLTKSTIIRLDVFEPVRRGSKHIVINELTILNHGHTACFEWSIMEAVPRLCDDFIKRLRVEDDIEQPVVQIIECQMMYNSKSQRNKIRLVIYDGAGVCYAWLPKQMSHLYDELIQLPIVQLEEYTLERCKMGKRLLTIFELTGLSRNAAKIKKKLNFASLLCEWTDVMRNFEPEV